MGRETDAKDCATPPPPPPPPRSSCQEPLCCVPLVPALEKGRDRVHLYEGDSEEVRRHGEALSLPEHLSTWRRTLSWLLVPWLDCTGKGRSTVENMPPGLPP